MQHPSGRSVEGDARRCLSSSPRARNLGVTLDRAAGAGARSRLRRSRQLCCGQCRHQRSPDFEGRHELCAAALELARLPKRQPASQAWPRNPQHAHHEEPQQKSASMTVKVEKQNPVDSNTGHASVLAAPCQPRFVIRISAEDPSRSSPICCRLASGHRRDGRRSLRA